MRSGFLEKETGFLQGEEKAVGRVWYLFEIQHAEGQSRRRPRLGQIRHVMEGLQWQEEVFPECPVSVA